MSDDKSTRAPTLEELRRVYHSEAPHRPHWPAHFDLAIRDPLTRRVLRILAAHVLKTQPAPVPALQRDAAHGHDAEYLAANFARPAPAQAPARAYAGRRQSALDFKSRAAGERDE